MADAAPIRPTIGLPPDETVRAFDARDELRQTVRWPEMWEEEHARAFTVAKMAKLDLLNDVRLSLRKVLAEGGTFEQWRADLQPRLEAAGWWGTVQDRELTGTDRAVLINPRRLQTIYDTNLRVSRAAGQWTRIQALKARAPYLRYSAIMDARTRPDHRRWHGTILPVDHEWWDTHFPPCGWRCRCTVIQLSERDLQRRGWKVSTPPNDGPPRSFWRPGAELPAAVPRGISPGFAYNPGKASLAAVGDKAVATIERVAADDLPGARRAVREIIDSPHFPALLDAPDLAFPVMVLDGKVRDPIGARSAVVTLSADTVAKQKLHHPEIGVAEYRRLPDIGTAPDLIYQQDDQRLIFLRDDERWLKAVVKATQDGTETYLVSLAYAGPTERRRIARRNTLLLGQLTGLLAAFLLGDDADGQDESAEVLA